MDDNNNKSVLDLLETPKGFINNKIFSEGDRNKLVLPKASLEVCQPLKRCEREVLFISGTTNASRRDEMVLVLISALTLAFILAELVGGYLAHSLAIMTDAFHMISDLASFLISILAIHLARRPPTAKYPYGFQRAEVLGALTSIIIIWVLTGLLIYMAIERIISNNIFVEPDLMMITAGIGVFFNLVIGALLYFSKTNAHHGHSHFGASGGHKDSQSSVSSDTSEMEQGQHKEHHHHKHVNLNIRAAFIHVVGDLVQSIGVLIAAVIIKFTQFELADPICTFIFGLLVLMTTMPVLKDTLEVLMEATPSQINLSKVCNDLVSIKGVSGVHSLRIWALKLDSTAISVHLDTSTEINVELSEIIAKAHQKLQQTHGFHFITVQAQCQNTTTLPAKQL